MFNQNTDPNSRLDQEIEATSRKIAVLEQEIKGVDQDCSALFEALEVRPEQITKLLSDPSNFTEGNWRQIEEQQRIRDEKIDRELANIQNPIKSRRTREEANTAQHWVFVK